MKENKKRKDYLQPDVAILSIDGESHLLAESPQARPGGGGGGTIQVIAPTEEDGGDDDNLVG